MIYVPTANDAPAIASLFPINESRREAIKISDHPMPGEYSVAAPLLSPVLSALPIHNTTPSVAAATIPPETALIAVLADAGRI